MMHWRTIRSRVKSRRDLKRKRSSTENLFCSELPDDLEVEQAVLSLSTSSIFSCSSGILLIFAIKVKAFKA